jgi:hypothetical protein
MRRLFRVKRDLTGNLPSLPAIFPDTLAPVVRTAPDGERELPAAAKSCHGASDERAQPQFALLPRMAQNGVALLGARNLVL